MEEKYISHSIEETQALAREIVSRLDSGTTLCLFGQLASGKTTFTQGVGNMLGIDRIVSPTYIIVRQYAVDNSNIYRRFYHVDLYRLSTYTESHSFDLDEIWSDPQGLTIIEWPERLDGHLPDKRLEIYFSILEDNKREIIIKSFNI